MFVAPQARADMPPEPDSCDGKRAGDPCDLEGPGSGDCETTTCSRLEYGGDDDELIKTDPVEPDGDEPRLVDPPSSGPRMVDYDCVQCVRAEKEAPTTPVETPPESTAPKTAPKHDAPPVSEPATRCALSPTPAPSSWTMFAVVLACVGRRRPKRAP